MKRNRLTTLLLALSLIVAMSQMSFAQEYSAQGGTYTYNGSDINASKQTSIREQISDKVEPGDSIDIVLTYKNSSDSATDWYLENEVLDTLESSSDMEGGYSYKLTNVGPGGVKKLLFSTAMKALSAAVPTMPVRALSRLPMLLKIISSSRNLPPDRAARLC